MPGLLSFNDPQTMGLLSAAAGLLQASGPSRVPVSFGQALGQGAMQGIGGYQQAQQFNQAARIGDLQAQTMETSLAANKRAQAAIDSFAQSLPEAQRGLFLANPAAFIKSATEGYTLSPGQTRMQGGNVVAAAPGEVRYQDAGDVLIPVNPQGQQAGPPIPKGMTPDTTGRINLDLYQWRNPSAFQQGQLGNERARIGLEGVNTYYNTGITVPGVPAIPQPGARPAFNTAPGVPPPAVAPSGLPLSPKAQQEAALAGAKKTAEIQAQSASDLPSTIAKAEQGISLIDQMIGDAGREVPKGQTARPTHPGFQDVIGATWKPGARFVPGTSASDFDALLSQVKGGAFMQAYETLKGGGQITEVEGRKATQAITRMERSQSEAEFIKAAREFQDVIRAGVQRAREKAGQAPGGWSIKPL